MVHVMQEVKSHLMQAIDILLRAFDIYSWRWSRGHSDILKISESLGATSLYTALTQAFELGEIEELDQQRASLRVMLAAYLQLSSTDYGAYIYIDQPYYL